MLWRMYGNVAWRGAVFGLVFSLIEIQIVLYSTIGVDARRHILEIVSALAVHAHSITIVCS